MATINDIEDVKQDAIAELRDVVRLFLDVLGLACDECDGADLSAALDIEDERAIALLAARARNALKSSK